MWLLIYQKFLLFAKYVDLMKRPNYVEIIYEAFQLLR